MISGLVVLDLVDQKQDFTALLGPAYRLQGALWVFGVGVGRDRTLVPPGQNPEIQLTRFS